MGIASLAGKEIADNARKAAVALAGTDDAGEDHGQVLLVALRGIFGVDTDEPQDAVQTADICKALNANDELPFGDYRKGEGINGRRLASLLRPHGIRPKNVRVVGSQGKGYECEQLEEAWERYAPHPRGSTPTGEASQASHRPTDAENGTSKPETAGTESGTDENPTLLDPSQNGAGTDWAQVGTDAISKPSRPQTALASGNEGVWDGRTDGTHDPQAVARARTDERRAAELALPAYDEDDWA